MKRLRKILLLLFIVTGLFAFLYWADTKDFFKANYRDLSVNQQKTFYWQAGDSTETLIQRYRQHFLDSQYTFPRQKVAKVKLFQNTPAFSFFTGKTLNPIYNESFLQFCNDTANFHWAETTWSKSESEYYCRLYDAQNNVVGKIYFCLDNCGMTSARPFSPVMKFGGLSEKGLTYIRQLISDEKKWE